MLAQWFFMLLNTLLLTERKTNTTKVEVFSHIVLTRISKGKKWPDEAAIPNIGRRLSLSCRLPLFLIKILMCSLSCRKDVEELGCDFA